MTEIGIALVGYGRWGENLARVLAASPRFELAAIVDACPGRRLVAASRFPAIPVLAELDNALKLSSVAAVAISTPPIMLAHLARQAVAKGRHVFLEKPGATTSSEALALAEQAELARVVLLVDFTAVWSPLQSAMANALAQGRLRQLRSWHAERNNEGSGPQGIDVLRDLAIHDLAVINALIAARPSKVAASDTALSADGRLSAARIKLIYDGGLTAEIMASWAGHQRRRTTTIVGSKAILLRDDVIDGEGVRIMRLFGDADACADQPILIEAGPRAGTDAEPLSRAIQAFAAAIEIGAPVQTDGRAASRLLDWIAAAERAIAAGGRPVDLADFRDLHSL
jgi:predicted dehydrogenase